MISLHSCLTIILSASFMLMGCASSSNQPVDQFYRLTRIEPLVKLSEPRINTTLVVERVRTYGIYQERTILYSPQDSMETLKYHYYHHWIDKPATLIREQLIDYLRDCAIAENVVSDNGRKKDGLHLQVNLKKFERHLHENGDVDVKIDLSFKLTESKNIIPILIRDYSEIRHAEDASMPASIRAFNLGLSSIYRQLSEDLLKSVATS